MPSKSIQLRLSNYINTMSIIGTIYEDVTTDVLGKIGTWQWLVTLMSTSIMVPVLFNQYNDMGLLRPAEIMCEPPEEMIVANLSLCYVTPAHNTTLNYKCDKWSLKLFWTIWLKKTWLVFCENKLKNLSMSVISRFGLVFGYIIFGLIADSFGRRDAILLSLLADIVLGLCITFCNSEGWFRLVIFLKSVFNSAAFFMGLVLICEISSNSWRSLLCTIAMGPQLVAMVCMVPIANSASNNETFGFIGCLYGILCFIVVVRCCPESPQWLLYNRKIIFAEKIIYRAAIVNHIKLCNEFKIRPVNHRAYQSLDQSLTCVGILNRRNIIVVFLMLSCLWILYEFMWTLIYVKIYSDERDTNLTAKLFCSIILLGSLTVWSAKTFKLRHLLLFHIIITGVFAAGVICFYKGTIYSYLAPMSLASGVISQAVILNMTPRLFALNIRATIVGCCHALGQLGAITSYLLQFFEIFDDQTQIGIALGVTSIIVWLCILLPDVDDRELPDVMDDMDYFSELSKPLRWVSQRTSSISREEIILKIYSFGSADRSSIGSRMEELRPAQPIGCVRVWRRILNLVRQNWTRIANQVHSN